MRREPSIRMTAVHHAQLMEHLFPGDGRETVAIATCGRSQGPERETLIVQQIESIAYSNCERAADFIT